MDSMVWIWLTILGVLTVIEGATVALIGIWFIGGAAVALVLALLGLPVWLQWTAFAVVSAGLLICLRPFMRRFIDSKKVSTNVDALVGKRAVVSEAIDNLHAQGAISIGGNVWTARGVKDAPIAADTVVIIRRIEGVKAFVEPEPKL